MQNEEIERLVSQFSRLPGMGSRSALRIVLHLLRKKHTVMSTFINSLQTVFQTSKICEVCGNIDTQSPCSICQSSRRDRSMICVVADIADLWSVERAGFYTGKYHVLGNKLSAVEGITPDDLNLDKLCERAAATEVKEVIIALSADLDGQTTLFFIKDRLKHINVKITTLSHGVPVGSELEYLDDGTIIAAFSQRRDV